MDRSLLPRLRHRRTPAAMVAHTRGHPTVHLSKISAPQTAARSSQPQKSPHRIIRLKPSNIYRRSRGGEFNPLDRLVKQLSPLLFQPSSFAHLFHELHIHHHRPRWASKAAFCPDYSPLPCSTPPRLLPCLIFLSCRSGISLIDFGGPTALPTRTQNNGVGFRLSIIGLSSV